MTEEDEQKGKKVNESEDTKTDSDEGNKPEIYKPIDDANIAAKRLEEANKERRELLDREENLMAKKALGGTTEAGAEPVKKEETPKEYAQKVMSGNLNE